MAEGIRIKHPKYRSTTYVVPVLDRPLTAPLYCHICEEDHICKTYHFDLDNEGCIIVSAGVFEELQKVGMASFKQQNTVSDPPTVTISQSRVNQALKKGKGRRIQK